jgi:hypothetical protein
VAKPYMASPLNPNFIGMLLTNHNGRVRHGPAFLLSNL